MKANFKSIEKLIISDGWELVRISGGHYQYKKPGVTYLVTIPHHCKDITIGVIKSIEKKTGLTIR